MKRNANRGNSATAVIASAAGKQGVWLAVLIEQLIIFGECFGDLAYCFPDPSMQACLKRWNLSAGANSLGPEKPQRARI